MSDSKKKFAIGSRASSPSKAGRAHREARPEHTDGRSAAYEPQSARPAGDFVAHASRGYEPTREFDAFEMREAVLGDRGSAFAGYEDIPTIEDILNEIENAPDLDEAASAGKGAAKSGGKKKTSAAKKGRAGAFDRFAEWFKKSAVNKLIVIGSSAAVVAIAACAVLLTGGKGPAVKPGVVDPADDVPVTDYEFVDKDEYSGVLLEKTEDAGSEYIDETLFIGDSNTARINLYGFLTLKNVIGVESMGIQGVTSQKCVYFEGYSEPVTIPEAVKLMQPQRIVICFGTNNLSYGSADNFITEYKNALNAVKEAYGYADIIIAAIPPVGKNAAVRQQDADEYNVRLVELAKSEGLTFLNISEALKGADGYIKSEYIIEDGIHISRSGFQLLGRYFRTHAHITEDRRPKPLNDIPTRKPAPAVHNDDGLDTDAVISEALKLFLANGFKSPTNDTDLSKGRTATFSVPYEQDGDEAGVAKNLYESVVAQLGGVSSGYVGITAKSSDSSKTHTFTIRILPDSETCKHEYGEWTVTKEATCSPGERRHTCTICGKTETEEIKPVSEHEWGEWTIVKEATCAAEGVRRHTCSKCKAVEEETIEKLPHTWDTTAANADAEGWVVTKAATCTAAGSRSRTCSKCKVVETGEIAALGHSWGEWTVTTAATCTTDGLRSRTCSVCHTTETEVIPATGHNYGDNKDQPTCLNGCGVSNPDYKPQTGDETVTTP